MFRNSISLQLFGLTQIAMLCDTGSATERWFRVFSNIPQASPQVNIRLLLILVLVEFQNSNKPPLALNTLPVTQRLCSEARKLSNKDVSIYVLLKHNGVSK